MATLVHDDQLDAAKLRRGRPTVWASRGEAAARATGDYLFARAFAELCTTGDMRAVTILSDACLALARGEILQREQSGDPATTPEQYLERCRLKTGRLFLPAMLGGRFGACRRRGRPPGRVRDRARPGVPDRRATSSFELPRWACGTTSRQENKRSCSADGRLKALISGWKLISCKA